jgi:DNA gyrase subunit A
VINVNYYHNFIVKCGDLKLVSHNCLHPDTEIPTTDGVYKISELEDKTFKVYTYDIDKKEVIISNETTAVNTITTNDYYEIELENGSIVKCTGNHLFLLKTGEYKRADELTEEDELEDINPNKLF